MTPEFEPPVQPDPPQPSDTAGVLVGARLLLCDPAADGYLVEAGRASVFLVEVRDGAPAGPREHVADARRGDAVFCGMVAGGGFQFLLLTSDDTVLRPLADADWAGGHLRPAAERWAEHVGNLSAAGFPLTESPSVAASTGTAALAANRVFRPAAMTVVWVRVGTGTVSWFGLPGATTAAPCAVPVSTRAWLRATEDATLAMLTGDAVTPAVVRSGLAAANAAAVVALRVRRDAWNAREAARIARRKADERRDTRGAVGELAAAVAPQPYEPPADGGLMAALDRIGRVQGITFRPPPDEPDGAVGGDPIAAVARSSRVRYRQVQLRGAWWRSDAGHLLGFLREDAEVTPVALLRRRSRYYLVDPRTGQEREATAADRAKLAPGAVMFYRPFPPRPLTLLDLPRYVLAMYRREAVAAFFLAVGVTALGMLLPVATRWMVDEAIPDADARRVWEMAGVLVSANVLTAAFLVAQGLISLRMKEGATAALQAATWDRVLRLPAGFFRQYASGDLLNRAMMVTEVSHKLSGTAVRTLFTGGLAVFNLVLLMTYSPPLAALAAAIGLVSVVVTISLALLIRRHALAGERAEGLLFGLVVQLVNGVAQLRVAGAARRAFNFWARRFAARLGYTAAAARLHDVGVLFHLVMPPLATLALFVVAAASLQGGGTKLTLGLFLAFNAAYLTFIGGITSAGHVFVDLADSLGKFRLVSPILTATPEVADDRADPGRLSGGIAVSDVVFRYTEGGRAILNRVSVRAAPGEFIALVGPSGSGKSTLLRLLLGFERPESGGVFYDGMPLDGLELTAVRRQLGVVLQSATITAGSVFENITSGNPLSMDDALQAARDAGLAEDLKAMPMGLHTVVAEGGSNLSGGQRQRLLIARALAANPRVILFDEATSALDNITQAIVTESLNRRRVTRVVVAHRLSTIRTADRIYLLAGGEVKQVGTYDELVAVEGPFRQLADRQAV